MRHLKHGRKLNRTTSHRKAMLANMASNLILHKQIKTTHPKAQETRSYVEHLITKAKKGDLHSRRMVLRKLKQKDVVKILFEDVAPVYTGRNGGYTRIIKLGQRKSDGARISILALVDFEGHIKAEDEKEGDKKSKKATIKAAKESKAKKAEKVKLAKPAPASAKKAVATPVVKKQVKAGKALKESETVADSAVEKAVAEGTQAEGSSAASASTAKEDNETKA